MHLIHERWLWCAGSRLGEGAAAFTSSIASTLALLAFPCTEDARLDPKLTLCATLQLLPDFPPSSRAPRLRFRLSSARCSRCSTASQSGMEWNGQRRGELEGTSKSSHCAPVFSGSLETILTFLPSLFLAGGIRDLLRRYAGFAGEEARAVVVAAGVHYQGFAPSVRLFSSLPLLSPRLHQRTGNGTAPASRPFFTTLPSVPSPLST